MPSEVKPWRSVAVPREDVRSGRIRRDEFAANLPLVVAGRAPKEYQDPESFYAQTYITEGIQGLLRAVLKRLTGKGGEPVIQLQTAFGGGKTHSLLCVYHLVRSGTKLAVNQDLKKILKELDMKDIPEGKVVVLDGTDFSPNQPREHGAIKARTLLGELAWQLGGEEGYTRVKAADETGTAVSQSEIAKMLSDYGPCVILLDEIVVYLRQLGDMQGQMTGGTIDQNLSFIQNLTVAVQGVSNCVILASLPASDGGVQAGGDVGARVLRSVEAIFGRVQALWKPVTPEEGYAIVRRRLFDPITDTVARDAACKVLFTRYAEAGIADDVPKEVREQSYLEKMEATYPFHPELFDRLYEDWTTLEGFQRTRGVLQLLSEVVQKLWESDHQDAFIMPADIPLDTTEVKDIMTAYLPPGWDAVIDSEVDGDGAASVRIDNSEPARFGQVRACRRVSRTVFLGSAPMGRSQDTGNHGLLRSHVLLGTLRVGDTPGPYRDAVDKLAELRYFSSSTDRLWFGVRPNLNQEARGRSQQISADQISECVKEYLRRAIHDSHFRTHVFVESEDIPDDDELRLAVLPMSHDATRKTGGDGEGGARIYANDILKYRGTTPRLNQNRLLFLAFDEGGIDQVARAVQLHLAWKSILEDADQNRIELMVSDVGMARTQVEGTRRVYENVVANACVWMMVPTQSSTTADSVGEIDFRVDRVQLNAIWRTLVSSEYVIERWAPQFLKDLATRWFFSKSVSEISIDQLWEKMCHYCYMPRLSEKAVLESASAKGVPDGLIFVKGTENRVLIPQAEQGAPVALPPHGSEATPTIFPASGSMGSTPVPSVGHKNPKKFFATFKLSSEQSSKTDYTKIYNEVIDHLLKNGGSVDIELSASGTMPGGYSPEIQRIVKENSNTLGARKDTMGFDNN